MYSGQLRSEDSGRSNWLDRLTRVVDPVLDGAARRVLHKEMPIGAVPGFEEARRESTRLEAVARSLLGLAPWLESSGLPWDERTVQEQTGAKAREALGALFEPDSPDFCDVRSTRQALVEAAFLGQALALAPAALWEDLDERTRLAVLRSLAATRVHQPHANNWLLFSAMVEVALCRLGEEWKIAPIQRALDQFEAWYVGDGAYADGEWFRWDFYNSLVIHPMLLDILAFCEDVIPEWAGFRDQVMARSQRMAVILERMVAPDGSFPPIGRSLAYRCGALHLLAYLAVHDELPGDLPAGVAREVLFSSIVRTLDAPGTFDHEGWLRPGLAGDQPGLAENYISTGSLYLCTVAFYPLGLDPSDSFWTAEGMPSTWAALWSGQDARADAALRDESLRDRSEAG